MKSQIHTNDHINKKWNPIAQVAIASLLLMVAALAVRFGVLAEADKAVFRWIYSLPDGLTPLFLFITQAGNIYVLLVLAGVYFLGRRFALVLRMLLTGFFAYLLSGVAKDLWGSERPFELLPDIIHREYIVRGPGFPSGHVALATAVLLVVGQQLPKRLRWAMWCTILGVMISRVYLGVHMPLDTIGGFAIGWLSYALFRLVRLQDVSPRRNIAVSSQRPRTKRKA